MSAWVGGKMRTGEGQLDPGFREGVTALPGEGKGSKMAACRGKGHVVHPHALPNQDNACGSPVASWCVCVCVHI